MPNWRKVLTSGSAGYLSNLTVDNAVTSSHLYVSDSIGLGTTSPDLAYSTMGMQIESDDSVALRLTDTTGADFEIAARSGDVLLYERNGKHIRFGTGGGERMRITSAGDIGIGTTSPGEKLHVSGNIMIENNKSLLSKRVAGNTLSLIGIDNTGQGIIEIGEASTIPDGMHIYTPTDAGQGVTFHNGTDPLMFIENDGSVGIGTTSPSSYNGSFNSLV